MSSGKRIQVVESEKSLKIFKLNKLLDEVNAKNIYSIELCEKAVVNRVTIDQKIMYKKFQTKVNRTKLFHARATGNRAMANDILEKTTSVLNTNIGNDDDEVLKKIWRAGSGAQRLAAKTSAGETHRHDDVGAQRSKSAAPQLQRHYQLANRDPNLPMRPCTTVSVAKPSVDKRPKTAGASFQPPRRRLGSVVPALTTEDCTALDPDGLYSGNTQVHLDQSKQYMYGQSEDHSMPFLETLSTQFLDTPPRSRRGSAYRRPSDTMTPSFGREPTLTELHKMWVDAKDYEGQVKRFAKTVTPLKMGKHNVTDYYTLRAMEHARSGRKKSVMNIPGTPPGEYTKDCGNMSTGNMTFRDIDWNFDERPNTFVDVTAF